MEIHNNLSIAHWTTWEKKAVIPHDRRKAINILLVGLSLCLSVKLLTLTPTILETIAELILDTIPEDYLWVLMSILPTKKWLMVCAIIIIYDLFI